MALSILVCWVISIWFARKIIYAKEITNQNNATLQFFAVLVIFSFAALSIEWWVGTFVAAVGATAFVTISNEKKKYDGALHIVEKHGKELAIRKKQLVTKESYGLTENKRWIKEKSDFIEKVVEPTCGRIDGLSPIYQKILSKIDDVALRDAIDLKFSPNLTPVEYEHFVADLLKSMGWDAKLTKASGDQGVDIIAKKRELSVAIQCKLYSNPVGNAAVQEVIAGKIFEKTQFAAVVTNNRFTTSAKKLAATSEVLLLHHDELLNIEAMLSP